MDWNKASQTFFTPLTQGIRYATTMLRDLNKARKICHNDDQKNVQQKIAQLKTVQKMCARKFLF